MKVDVYIKLEYNVKESKVVVKETNIKKDMIVSFLEEWVQDQIGRGEDKRKTIDRDVYEVVIGCRLEDDTFAHNSNSGNDSLDTGIVMHYLAQVENKK